MKREVRLSALNSKAREIVVKVLYEVELGELDSERARERISRKCSRPGIREFALTLFEETLAHRDALDRIIVQLAKNWHISRMAAIDRNVLRMAILEILLSEDVPDKVAINEAIEIAKRFSTENSGRFVNGILDAVARSKVDLRSDLGYPREP
jgi:N utilization substance protein B